VAYYNRGNGKLDLEDKQGALSDYNEAIRLNPDYAAAYMNRGSLKYSVFGDNQGALSDFNESIRLRPNDYRAYQNLGVVYDKMGDMQKAEAYFLEAKKLQQMN
jgi:tetratricopeptide (TPR) repeat protein